MKLVRIAPMGAAATAWRFVVQRRVRSFVIVLFAPFFQLLARLTHALELDSTQYLVAHCLVVALYRLRSAVQTYQPVQRLRNIVAPKLLDTSQYRHSRLLSSITFSIR